MGVAAFCSSVQLLEVRQFSWLGPGLSAEARTLCIILRLYLTLLIESNQTFLGMINVEAIPTILINDGHDYPATYRET